MSKPFQGIVNVDVTDSVPDWSPYVQPIAPEGAPSVAYIVLDDVGFSAMEPFGGLIETPNISRIAERGLRYTNFHRRRPASCSRTARASAATRSTGKFSIAGEGLNVGKEGAEPVTDDYPGGYPWVFIGGTIHKAMVDVSGTPFVDLASDARMAFARD